MASSPLTLLHKSVYLLHKRVKTTTGDTSQSASSSYALVAVQR